jgi:predicted transcriptional regulator
MQMRERRTVSQGTIKAIEQGMTDARLSTLRKLAQTVAAHDVQFVATGPWTGVVIKSREGVMKRKPLGPEKSLSVVDDADDDSPISGIKGTGDSAAARGGLQWLGTVFRTRRIRKS